MSTPPVIAVVGAGFSGVLAALRLLETGPPGARIFLIEKTPGFGRGLAYGAHNPNHLLNVRVGNMSAFPEAPDHLIRWLADRGGWGGQDRADAFITRGTYGDYLASLLRAAIARPDGAERLVLVADAAVGLSFADRGCILDLAMGRRLSVDAVVLAAGALAPVTPAGAGLEALGPQLFAPDPWARGALDRLDPLADVLLLGSGLTMVDIALDLVARGHRGRLVALSRRGLAPHRHERVSPVAGLPAEFAQLPLSSRLRERRRRAAEVGWREAVDELRPITQDLWRAADLTERQRFLRHLRPWWDIHRHRMAPAVADKLDALRADGRLLIRSGRVVAASPAGEEARIEWRPRGSATIETLLAGRVLNCTGIGADLSKTRDPLLKSLIDQGVARPDGLGLGLEIDNECRVVGADGRLGRPLYAAGPITQGYSWEVTAVPDIRKQVTALATALTARLSERGND